MDRITTNSKIIQANKEKVYNAFTDRRALEFWLAPYGITGKIHDFNLKIGDGCEMSLFYNDTETEGKTSGNEDRFSATFTESYLTRKLFRQLTFNRTTTSFKMKW